MIAAEIQRLRAEVQSDAAAFCARLDELESMTRSGDALPAAIAIDAAS